MANVTHPLSSRAARLLASVACSVLTIALFCGAWPNVAGAARRATVRSALIRQCAPARRSSSARATARRCREGRVKRDIHALARTPAHGHDHRASKRSSRKRAARRRPTPLTPWLAEIPALAPPTPSASSQPQQPEAHSAARIDRWGGQRPDRPQLPERGAVRHELVLDSAVARLPRHLARFASARSRRHQLPGSHPRSAGNRPTAAGQRLQARPHRHQLERDLLHRSERLRQRSRHPRATDGSARSRPAATDPARREQPRPGPRATGRAGNTRRSASRGTDGHTDARERRTGGERQEQASTSWRSAATQTSS